MHDLDELDRLLDAAIHSYAEPGVDFGLERRVLDCIAAEEKSVDAESHPRWHRSQHILALSFSAAVCAVLLVVAAPRLFHRSTQRTEESQQVASTVQSSGRAAPAITTRTADLHAQKAVHRRPKSPPALHPALQASLPKLDRFPVSQPLTTEEKALIALAVQHPDRAASVFTHQPAHPPEPLTIAAIRIAPIEMPSPGKN